MLNIGYNTELGLISENSDIKGFDIGSEVYVSNDHLSISMVENHNLPSWSIFWKARTAEWFYVDKFCNEVVDFARKIGYYSE